MAHAAPHVQLKVWLPADDADELRKLAEAEDRSVTAEIRRAIKAHLDASKEAVT